MRDSLPARFWAKVNRRGDDECWEWLASKNDGYGHMRIDRQHMEKAHRISYRLHHGEIPEGFCVMHKCDNRACVNPKHLSLGSLADNNTDRNAKSRQAMGERLSVVKRGELHGAARLTEEQVLEIRRRYIKGGVTQMQLADEYGVGRANIGAITIGRSWRHLAGPE